MKKYYKFLLVILVVSVIIPQIAFAAWWNPVTWKIWDVFRKPQAAKVEPEKTQSDKVDNVKENKQQELSNQNSTTKQVGEDVSSQIIEAPQKIKSSQQASIATPSQEQPSEAKILIKEFLDNPSPDNFRVFCDKAKNVKSSQTKESLSADRTQMELVNKTLFEVVDTCRTITNPEIIFVSDLDSLLVSLNGTDTDSIRIKKLDYNKQLKELGHQYKIYGYWPCGTSSLNSFFNYVFSDLKSTASSARTQQALCLKGFIKNIKIPEAELKNVLKHEK